MTVGHLILTLIGIGWLSFTCYVIHDVRGKKVIHLDLSASIIIINVALLIGGITFLTLSYWNTVIF